MTSANPRLFDAQKELLNSAIRLALEADATMQNQTYPDNTLTEKLNSFKYSIIDTNNAVNKLRTKDKYLTIEQYGEELLNHCKNNNLVGQSLISARKTFRTCLDEERKIAYANTGASLNHPWLIFSAVAIEVILLAAAITIGIVSISSIAAFSLIISALLYPLMVGTVDAASQGALFSTTTTEPEHIEELLMGQQELERELYNAPVVFVEKTSSAPPVETEHDIDVPVAFLC